MEWVKDINQWDDITAQTDKGVYRIRRQIFSNTNEKFFLVLAQTGQLLYSDSIEELKEAAAQHLTTGSTGQDVHLRKPLWSLEYP